MLEKLRRSARKIKQVSSLERDGMDVFIHGPREDTGVESFRSTSPVEHEELRKKAQEALQKRGWKIDPITSAEGEILPVYRLNTPNEHARMAKRAHEALRKAARKTRRR